MLKETRKLINLQGKSLIKPSDKSLNLALNRRKNQFHQEDLKTIRPCNSLGHLLDKIQIDLNHLADNHYKNHQLKELINLVYLGLSYRKSIQKKTYPHSI